MREVMADILLTPRAMAQYSLIAGNAAHALKKKELPILKIEDEKVYLLEKTGELEIRVVIHLDIDVIKANGDICQEPTLELRCKIKPEDWSWKNPE